MLLDDAEFERNWHEQGKLSGAEHDVFFDPATDRWIKT